MGKSRSALTLTAPPFDRITFDDPRVLAICGRAWTNLGPMTIAEASKASKGLRLQTDLNACAPQLQRWANRAATITLDELAADLLTAWETSRQPPKQLRRRAPRPPDVSSPPLDPAARKAVIARLGLAGQPPTTLQRAGNSAGLTRERVRQVTNQVLSAAQTTIWAPTLDEALGLADHAATAAAYTQLLQANSLTSEPWHPTAVASLARLCRRTPPASLKALADVTTHAKTIRAAASTLINKFCLAPLTDIAQTAGHRIQQTITIDQVRAALQLSDRHVVGDTWVGPRHAHANRGRLAHVTLRLLTLAKHTHGTITVTDIHKGLQRRLRQRGIHDLPTPEAIAAYLAANPDFNIHTQPHPATAAVTSRIPLPALDDIFAHGARTIIDIINIAPGKVVTRDELFDGAKRNGVLHDATNQILLYHEALAHHSHRLWTLTGTEVTESAAKAAKARLTPRQPEGLHSNDSGPRPWWALTITSAWLRHARLERQSLASYAGTYEATDHDGHACGTLIVRSTGRLYGLHAYVRRHQPALMTRIRITLDPANHTATIENC